MLTLTDPTLLPPDLRGAVAALGNFDGVHRGHREVIGSALDRARHLGTPTIVVTFEPHPRQVLRPNDPPFRLSTPAGKTRALAELGVAAMISLPFDKDLASRSPQDFIQRILVEALGIAHVVIGYDFRFGHKRAGDASTLMAAGEDGGFGLTVVTQAGDDSGGVFSSTRVRESLVAGNPSAARTVLGRPWEIEGTVEQGDQRGRTLGFPTANVRLGALLRPAYGVYAVQCAVDAAAGEAVYWYPGVANLGIRPMWETDEPYLEAHLLDVNLDLYGKVLRCRLIEYLRPEMKFDGIDALVVQMNRDTDRARALLEGTGE